MLSALPPSPTVAFAATDQTVLKAAQARDDQVIAPLKDLVAIESGPGDPGGLERMAAHARNAPEELGGHVEMLAATNGTPPGLVRASFQGSGALRVMLIAHTDTVYHRGIPGIEPYRREGSKRYGPGIADDKGGGMAVILNALDLPQALDWKNYATITVLFNPDEELGFPGTSSILAEKGSHDDVALSFEPSPPAAIGDMPGGAMAFSGRNLLLIPETTGGTDAGFAAQSDVPAVIESMGLAGCGFHAKNEYIEIDSIIPRLYLTARMLMVLGQQANAGNLP